MLLGEAGILLRDETCMRASACRTSTSGGPINMDKSYFPSTNHRGLSNWNAAFALAWLTHLASTSKLSWLARNALID